MGVSGQALAATGTYTSTDVPKTVAEGETKSSTLTVPGEHPKITDIDVIGVSLTAGAGAGDQTLSLANPGGATGTLLTAGCNIYPAGTNINFDDQAGGVPFAFDPGHCSSLTSGSTFLPSSASPLTALLTGAAGGTWSLAYSDGGITGTGGSLSAWGLRLTFSPLSVTATAKKQGLAPKLRIRATCNGDCQLTTGGDGKKRTFTLHKDAASALKVPLKSKALQRLENGGKAKIQLTAGDDLGDSATSTVKVKVTG